MVLQPPIPRQTATARERVLTGKVGLSTSLSSRKDRLPTGPGTVLEGPEARVFHK